MIHRTLSRRPIGRRGRRAVTAAVLESIEPRRLMSVASPTFGTGGTTTINLNGDTSSVALTAANAAGKIVTVSALDSSAGSFVVARFNADGSPDATFANGGSTIVSPAGGTDLHLSDVAITADGSAFVGTIETDSDGNAVGLVSRVGADGVAITTTIGTAPPTGADLDLAASANGNVYASFNYASDDGSINAATITCLNGVIDAPVTLYGTEGFTTLDLPGSQGAVSDLIVDATGATTVVGTAFAMTADGTYDGREIFAQAINAAGSPGAPVTTTAPTFTYTAGAIAPRAGGGFVVVGDSGVSQPDGTIVEQSTFVGLKSTLAIDGGFGTLGYTTVTTPGVYETNDFDGGTLAVDNAGGIYAPALYENDAAGVVSAAVIKLDATGKLDATFGNNGVYVSTTPAQVAYSTDVDATPDGGAVVTTIVDGTPTLYKIAGPVVTPPPPPPPVLPYTITNGTLALTGTSGNDVISVAKGAAAGTLVLTVNGVAYPIATPVTGIAIDGGAGNDLIKISNSITIPATLTGGAGDDTLRGGGGNDVLLGGDGNDALIGRDGQDFLLGGTGSDYLIGSVGDDILLNGTTTLNQAGIDAVMKEWTSKDNLLVKLADVTGLLPLPGRANGSSYLTPGVTIFNDTSVDTLSGGDGADFYYAQLFGTNADVIQDNMTKFRSDVASLVIGD